MRVMMLSVAVLSLCGCHGYLDPRCQKERYYCISTEADRQSYLETVSDIHLIQLARMEYRTSRPPTAFYIVKEIKRRGGLRSKRIVQEYSSEPVDEELLDEFVRELTASAQVCRDWTMTAPAAAQKRLLASCRRVYAQDQMLQLKSAAQESKKLIR